MHNPNVTNEGRGAAAGAFLKRAAAWIILVAVAIIVLKLVIGSIIGFLLTVLAVVAVVAAVIWAFKHL